MIELDEKKLIRVIKYTPPILILFLSIIVSFYIYNEHSSNIEAEKQTINTFHLNEEKQNSKNWVDTIHQYLSDLKKGSKEELKYDLKNHVLTAYGVVYRIYNKYKDVKAKEEIVDIIKTTLRTIRFNDGRGYLFIYELKGKNILNGDFPELEGKNLWNYKDAKGVFLLQEMYEILQKKDETFYEWYWDKVEDGEKEHKKLGFFKKFEPYDWFIGTGEYVKEFEKIQKKRILDYINKVRFEDNRDIIITTLKGRIISCENSNNIGKNIKSIKEFQKYYNNLSSLEKGEFVNYKIEKNIGPFSKADKMSYVRLLSDWDWVIGSELNLDNIKLTIKQRQEELENYYKDYLNKTIIGSLLLTLVLLIISHYISKIIENSFYNYKSKLENKNQTLLEAQKAAHIGDWKLALESKSLHLSDEIKKILGVPSKDLIFELEFFKEIMKTDDWLSFEKLVKKTIEDAKECSSIYKVTRLNDDKEVWIDCKGQLSKDRRYIYGTVQDITERKILEDEREQKETILYQQSKMAAMGEMIGNIAHQWRQPLSVISTAATGAKVQSELGILDKKGVEKYLSTINDTVQHLSQTIEDFRSFFKPKDDQLSEFNISESMAKALNLVSTQYKANNIRIVKNVKDVKLYSLENELIQALINILNNSRDALLELKNKESKVIFIDVYEKNNNLIIEIKDNAGGVPEAIIDRIFEPYFTTKHQKHGTGIGLYMTQKIVTKLLGGSIVVKNQHFFFENDELKGANFIIIIPLKVDKNALKQHL